MGSKPASGELTIALLPLFKEFCEAHVIHDDVIISTKTLEHHQKILPRILNKIEGTGLTLNEEKCIFMKQEIPFWGLLISKDGIKPDPEKVEALNHTGPPETKEDVMSFLCMIQSLSNFIPNLLQKTFNLRQLTKKYTHFQRKKCHQLEFHNLSHALHKNTLSTFFQPKQPTFCHLTSRYQCYKC